MLSMDRLRWARPNVLEQVLRANLLAMIGRLRGLFDTFVHFADVISPADASANVVGRRESHQPKGSNSRVRLCRIAHHREMNLPG
jgi:hypothetical protein